MCAKSLWAYLSHVWAAGASALPIVMMLLACELHIQYGIFGEHPTLLYCLAALLTSQDQEDRPQACRSA